MFPANRQEKLNPILKALEGVAGVTGIVQDDFDSASIRVHMTVKGTKYKLERPLAAIKANIAKLCRQAGVSFEWSNQPQKRWSDNGSDGFGKRLRFDEGYDSHLLSLDVYV